MINERFLTTLIEIGKKEDFEKLKNILPADKIERYGEIMRHHHSEWYKIADKMNTEDLVGLIKSLTIAEEILTGWGAGSVSPVIWLYKKLEQRKPEDMDVITDWILKNTNNEWSPFSLKLGARSLKELKEFRKEYYKTKTEKENEELNRRIKAAERRKTNYIRHKEISENIKQEREDIVSRLKNMSFMECIDFIANDNEHSIDIIPKEYINIDENTVQSIDSLTKEMLINKIESRKTRHWRKIKKLLEK